jgi:hypothetical protein
MAHDAAHLVHLNVPLSIGLELLKVLLELDSLALANSLEHVLHRETNSFQINELH